MEYGVLGLLTGLALFLFPGITWALALAPGLDGPRAVALSLILSFTVAPATLFFLHLLFAVPLNVATMAYLAVAVGMAGLALRLAPFVLSHVAD